MQPVKKKFACLSLFLSLMFMALTPTLAFSQPFANIELSSDSLAIYALQDVDAISVRVVGKDFSFQQQYTRNNIVLDLSSMKIRADGRYEYEVKGIKYTGESQVVNGNGRAQGTEMKESMVSSITGNFIVRGHTILSKF
ncbi:hypothetical protein TDB9533_02908 [Thalassocella blandensis]|nr:hypothetical protein TDB9533_02908 [Thalassocella blandensis]